MSDNGHGEDRPAVKLLRLLAAGSKEHKLRSIVRAIGKVYRRGDTNQVDHSICEVLRIEKDLHGMTENELLDALVLVFNPIYPIVYPDDFKPVLIIAPNGKILWQEPAKEEPAPAIAPIAAQAQD